MDGKNVDIVTGEAPNSKCTAEGSDAITSGLCYLNAARMYMQRMTRVERHTNYRSKDDIGRWQIISSGMGREEKGST